MTTLTVLVPAFNEEDGIAKTIESLLNQTVAPEEIIVVDDGSTDRTAEIAMQYPVTLVQPPHNLGSKAKAQTYALPDVTTDLVLPMDADTVFAENYIELIKKPFDDESVSIAAGCVLTDGTNTVWEKGRFIEYMVGFHFFRIVQGKANSPVVCSGCCTAFRMTDLVAFGGFPERTMCEDIDYTFSQQIAGKKAVYVGEAVAYAHEPTSRKFICKQLWRWKTGHQQSVRLHWKNMIKKKPMLAIWVLISMFEIVISPLTMILPFVWLASGMSFGSMLGWWIMGEALLTGPPLIYGAWKRKINPWTIIKSYPSYYVLKVFNFWFDWRAIITEWILVPLGWSKGLRVYEKGH